MVVSFIATSTCSAFIMGHVLSNFTGAHTSIVPLFSFSLLIFCLPEVQAHVIPGFPFCIPLDVPHYLFAFWIPIIAFESLLCGMALFRGFQAFRYRQNVLRAGRHLVTLLLRDSIIYYIMCVFFYKRFSVIVLTTSTVFSLPISPISYSGVPARCVVPHPSILSADQSIYCVGCAHRDTCRLLSRDVLRDGKPSHSQCPTHETRDGRDH